MHYGDLFDDASESPKPAPKGKGKGGKSSPKKTTPKKPPRPCPKDLKYPPGQPILVKFMKGTEAFWCSGYEVFDPNRLHSVTGSKGGYTSLTPKRSRSGDRIWILRANQTGRIISEKLSNIRLPKEHDGPTWKFGDVFPQFASTSKTTPDFTGFVFDAPDEDLPIPEEEF
jgi:hypothetical protein